MSIENDQQLAADAAGFIADFGEPIIYYQCDDKGNVIAQPNIQAVVNRNPPAVVQEDGKTLADDIEICIANDVNLGVIQVNKGRDKIAVSGRWGGPVKNHLVTLIVSGDAGIWTLRVK